MDAYLLVAIVTKVHNQTGPRPSKLTLGSKLKRELEAAMPLQMSLQPQRALDDESDVSPVHERGSDLERQKLHIVSGHPAHRSETVCDVWQYTCMELTLNLQTTFSHREYMILIHTRI